MYITYTHKSIKFDNTLEIKLTSQKLFSYPNKPPEQIFHKQCSTYYLLIPPGTSTYPLVYEKEHL